MNRRRQGRTRRKGEFALRDANASVASRIAAGRRRTVAHARARAQAHRRRRSRRPAERRQVDAAFGDFRGAIRKSPSIRSRRSQPESRRRAALSDHRDVRRRRYSRHHRGRARGKGTRVAVPATHRAHAHPRVSDSGRCDGLAGGVRSAARARSKLLGRARGESALRGVHQDGSARRARSAADRSTRCLRRVRDQRCRTVGPQRSARRVLEQAARSPEGGEVEAANAVLPCDESRHAALALSLLPGVGAVRFRELVAVFGSPLQAWDAIAPSLERDAASEDAERAIERAGDAGAQILVSGDAALP